MKGGIGAFRPGGKGRRLRFRRSGRSKTFCGAALFFSLFVLISAGWGDTYLSPWKVFSALLGCGTDDDRFILFRLRLPRGCTAALVGAALGTAGAILQGMIRNSLASPDMIGITGGAAVAAVAFLVYGGAGIGWLPAAAILGAVAAALAIYALAWKKGVSSIRLVLIGIGMNAAMGAGTTFMLVMSSSFTAAKAYVWLTGSVYGATWRGAATILAAVCVCMPVALWFARSLNIQELGDETAAGLGVRIQRHRFALLLVTVVLAGTAVAVAGAVGFVGLLAPHIARRAVGRSMRALLPWSALVGGALVYAADLISRSAFYPIDVPAGIFTAGVGAPFFLYLLIRKKQG